MSDLLKSLFAADQVAQNFGVGLNPKLRDAIQAELRYPSKSAGPDHTIEDSAELPENVVRFAPAAATDPKRMRS